MGTAFRVSCRGGEWGIKMVKGVAMRRHRRAERGAAALEFALVLPILLLLVFGIINFGVVFAQNLAISNAARQAARFGAVDGHTCDSIIAEAEGNSASINLDPDDLVITVERNGVGCSGATEPCAGSTEGDSVDVTVTYDSPTLIPFPPFPNTIEIEAKGEFRCEFS